MKPPAIPTATSDGQLYELRARLANDIVWLAFDHIGGQDTYNSWAQANQTEFFNKHFLPQVGRAKSAKAEAPQASIEDYLLALDNRVEQVVDQRMGDRAIPIEVNFEVKEEAPASQAPRFKVHPADCDCETRLPKDVARWKCGDCGQEWVDDAA